MNLDQYDQLFRKSWSACRSLISSARVFEDEVERYVRLNEHDAHFQSASRRGLAFIFTRFLRNFDHFLFAEKIALGVEDYLIQKGYFLDAETAAVFARALERPFKNLIVGSFPQKIEQSPFSGTFFVTAVAREDCELEIQLVDWDGEERTYVRTLSKGERYSVGVVETEPIVKSTIEIPEEASQGKTEIPRSENSNFDQWELVRTKEGQAIRDRSDRGLLTLLFQSIKSYKGEVELFVNS